LSVQIYSKSCKCLPYSLHKKTCRLVIQCLSVLNCLCYDSEGNKESDEEFVERFSAQVETVIRGVLYAIQCLVERKQKGGEEEEKPSEETGEIVNLIKG